MLILQGVTTLFFFGDSSISLSLHPASTWEREAKSTDGPEPGVPVVPQFWSRILGEFLDRGVSKK